METALWPYGKCKKCANKNYCAWSESEILNCMNNGYTNFSPMRNADRIRAMSDEELAAWLCDVAGWLPTFEGRLHPILEWLKQEAGDGHD
jgi:hypothetical protein